MADKTTGELTAVKVGDLPLAPDVYDDSLLPVEMQGTAMHITGAQWKRYAVAAVKTYSDSASQSAATAKGLADRAITAMNSIQNALDNLPTGDTLIINDLTTGGTTAALSAEMGKVLGQRPNRNILINTDFGNPVNQRGRTEYSENGYTIDCWGIMHSTASITLGDKGITLRDSTPGYLALRQTLNQYKQYIGKTLTLSCLVSEISGTGILIADFSSDSATRKSVAFSEAGVHSVTFAVPSDAEHIRIVFATRAGFEYVTIQAAKLEIGSTQTLAHQDTDGNWVLNEITNYDEELRKCQYYQMAYSFINTGMYFLARADSTTNAYAVVYTPSIMRGVNPTITTDASKLVLRSSTTTEHEISGVFHYTSSRNMVILRIESSGLTPGAIYQLRANGSVQLIIDRNL